MKTPELLYEHNMFIYITVTYWLTLTQLAQFVNVAALAEIAKHMEAAHLIGTTGQVLTLHTIHFHTKESTLYQSTLVSLQAKVITVIPGMYVIIKCYQNGKMVWKKKLNKHMTYLTSDA